MFLFRKPLKVYMPISFYSFFLIFLFTQSLFSALDPTTERSKEINQTVQQINQIIIQCYRDSATVANCRQRVLKNIDSDRRNELYQYIRGTIPERTFVEINEFLQANTESDFLTLSQNLEVRFNSTASLVAIRLAIPLMTALSLLIGDVFGHISKLTKDSINQCHQEALEKYFQTLHMSASENGISTLDPEYFNSLQPLAKQQLLMESEKCRKMF